MTGIKFNTICQPCKQTGIYTYINSSGETITQDPCPYCNGDGIMETYNGLEMTWFNELSEKVDDIQDKVKKIKKTVDDIWDKVK